ITRIDLELESRAPEAATVFGLFARPHTTAGAAALRADLLTPRDSVGAIQVRQDAIRDCRKSLDTFASFVERAQPGRIGRYLRFQSAVPRVPPGAGGMLSSAWLATRHPECLAIAREGRDAVARLVAACREWIAQSAATHASDPLKSITAEMEVTLR